jgi:hypothetical protein
MAKHFQRPDLWNAIFSGILAMTAVGALWYARDQIREGRTESEVQIQETRQQAQIQHLLELANEFDQEPMATYRRGLADKRLHHPNDDDPKELYRVLDFFETVGLLVNRGYLNEEDVWNEFGYWVLNLNADPEMRANVDYENNRDPNEYAVYMQLVGRLQRIDAAHYGSNARPLAKDDVMNFYREELTIVGGTPIRTHRAERKKS